VRLASKLIVRRILVFGIQREYMGVRENNRGLEEDQSAMRWMGVLASHSARTYFPPCFLSTLAQVSFNATVRSNTGLPGFESGSTQKYPRRSN
jgi:hypothetical protein